MYLTIALGALLGSFFFFFLPESDILQKSLIGASFWIGFLLLLFALMAVWVTFLQLRCKVLLLKKGATSTTVEPAVLEGYLKQYWKRVFPAGNVAQRVRVGREKILVEITFPSVPESEQKRLIRQIEGDVKDIFHSLVGYEGTVELVYEFSKK